MSTQNATQVIQCDIKEECVEAFSKGSLPLMQLIALKQSGGSLQQRVNYMLAGIDTVGTLNSETLGHYFTYLNRAVPEKDFQMHQQALSVVFNAILDQLIKRAVAMSQEIAGAMSLEETIHINAVVKTSAEPFVEAPEELDSPLEDRVLH